MRHYDTGYEIATQGDAFELAFGSVDDAVAFCLAVQQRLSEVIWPPAVLALPFAAEEFCPRTKRRRFAGPRVRMGKILRVYCFTVVLSPSHTLSQLFHQHLP